MPSTAGFHPYPLVAFIATTNASAARRFYRDLLGLRLKSEDDWVLVFDANGTMLRVTLVQELSPPTHTVLGWAVPDIVAAVRRLGEGGIALERHPNLDQDGLGIWTPPGGARIAWFKDPDGQTLSLTQVLNGAGSSGPKSRAITP